MLKYSLTELWTLSPVHMMPNSTENVQPCRKEWIDAVAEIKYQSFVNQNKQCLLKPSQMPFNCYIKRDDTFNAGVGVGLHSTVSHLWTNIIVNNERHPGEEPHLQASEDSSLLFWQGKWKLNLCQDFRWRRNINVTCVSCFSATGNTKGSNMTRVVCDVSIW